MVGWMDMYVFKVKERGDSVSMRRRCSGWEESMGIAIELQLTVSVDYFLPFSVFARQ
jgi:hypothetical protein